MTQPTLRPLWIVPPIGYAPGYQPAPDPPMLPAPMALPGPMSPELEAMFTRISAQTAYAVVGLLADLYPYQLTPPESVRLCLPVSNIGVTVLAGATTTLISTQPFIGSEGRITSFGNTGSDLTALTWTILIKNTPINPIAGLVAQYGTLAAPTLIPGYGIPFWDGDDIQVTVKNTSGGSITAVQCILHAFAWPVKRKRQAPGA